MSKKPDPKRRPDRLRSELARALAAGVLTLSFIHSPSDEAPRSGRTPVPKTEGDGSIARRLQTLRDRLRMSEAPLEIKGPTTISQWLNWPNWNNWNNWNKWRNYWPNWPNY